MKEGHNMYQYYKTEYPWSQWYDKYCIRVNKSDGRKHISLSGYKKHMTTSYARYLYAVHLCIMIPDNLHVDHINNDPTDDRIDNYQLLTPNENTKKANDHKIHLSQNFNKKYIEHINNHYYHFEKFRFIPNTCEVESECDYCGKTYTRHIYRIKYKIDKGQVKQYCTRNCYGKDIAYLEAKPEIINNIKQMVLEGISCNKISKVLKISSPVVEKYAALLTNKEFPKRIQKIITDELKTSINELAMQGLTCFRIAKELSIDFSTVKRYATVPIIDGKKEGNPNRLKQGVIDRINSFDATISNNIIAKTLGTTCATVGRYRESKLGKLPSVNLPERIKLPKETIEKINELAKQGYTTKEITEITGISKDAINRYRTDTEISDDLTQDLAEMIFLRKKRISLGKIRNRLGIGKNRISVYVQQITRPDIQDKLKDYKINEYSYYNIFQSISEKPSLPEETELNADLSLCNKFISYHDYQISALKSIHASNGDYTIYSTIETDDDVVFVVISGT